MASCFRIFFKYGKIWRLGVLEILEIRSLVLMCARVGCTRDWGRSPQENWVVINTTFFSGPPYLRYLENYNILGS
jgi:hypothetical protein